MTRDEQEAEELFALNRFRDISNELVGSARGDDPPDFVIQSDGRRVTVEMVLTPRRRWAPRMKRLRR
jgi:hypothetical protein